jgi:hypothetical protein
VLALVECRIGPTGRVISYSLEVNEAGAYFDLGAPEVSFFIRKIKEESRDEITRTHRGVGRYVTVLLVIRCVGSAMDLTWFAPDRHGRRD